MPGPVPVLVPAPELVVPVELPEVLELPGPPELLPAVLPDLDPDEDRLPLVPDDPAPVPSLRERVPVVGVERSGMLERGPAPWLGLEAPPCGPRIPEDESEDGFVEFVEFVEFDELPAGCAIAEPADSARTAASAKGLNTKCMKVPSESEALAWHAAFPAALGWTSVPRLPRRGALGGSETVCK